MKRLAMLFVACALSAAVSAQAARFTGTIYVTHFNTHNVDSVHVINGIIVPNSQGTIATLPGSDGIVCRDSTLALAVGGQLSNNVYRLNATTGAFSPVNTTPVPGGAFHVKFNNAQSEVWTTGLTNNQLAVVNWFTGATVNHTVTGLDAGMNEVSGIEFVPSGAAYVSDAPAAGGGSVYSLNTTTFAATKVLDAIHSAHGLNYDPYLSGLLGKPIFIIDGETFIDFYDFSTPTPTLLKSLDASALVGAGDQAHLDQGWVDGKGNFFVASNNGPIIYVDLTQWPNVVAELSGDTGYGTDDLTGCLKQTFVPPPTCDNNAKSWGYWKHQCNSKVANPKLAAWFDSIRVNSKVFGASGCFKASCTLLNTKFKGNQQGKAAQQYLALMLNVRSGLVSRACSVSCGGGGDHEDGDDDKGDKGGKGGRGEGRNRAFGHVVQQGVLGVLNCNSTHTVGDVIRLLEDSLCVSGRSTSYYSRLTCLAECANTFAEGGGHEEDDDAVSPSGRADEMVAGVRAIGAFSVERVGTNPARLSDGGVSFRISAPGVNMVRLGIYDAAGRMVAQPVRDRAITGQTTIRWDGATMHGSRAAAGTYFYRATSGETVQTGRFLLIP